MITEKDFLEIYNHGQKSSFTETSVHRVLTILIKIVFGFLAIGLIGKVGLQWIEISSEGLFFIVFNSTILSSSTLLLVLIAFYNYKNKQYSPQDERDLETIRTLNDFLKKQFNDIGRALADVDHVLNKRIKVEEGKRFTVTGKFSWQISFLLISALVVYLFKFSIKEQVLEGLVVMIGVIAIFSYLYFTVYYLFNQKLDNLIKKYEHLQYLLSLCKINQ